KLSVSHWTYHGDMKDRDRKSSQAEFFNHDGGLMLATPAFGLGINKADIRMVIHAEMPGSVEAYYQEVGRAGRDGEEAWCVLLHEEDDATIQMDFIKWANPDPAFIRTVYRLLETNSGRFQQEGVDFLRQQMNFYN